MLLVLPAEGPNQFVKLERTLQEQLRVPLVPLVAASRLEVVKATTSLLTSFLPLPI